jgi:hypothetical protein
LYRSDWIEETDMRKHIGFTLAALALAAPAWGQLQGSAQATGLHYTLGDLAPNDGIAPSASFTSEPSASLTGQATDLPFHGQPFQRYSEITVTAPASLAPDWHPQVRPMLSFDAAGLHTSLSVDPRADATLAGFASASLSPWFFQLAPHTSITFSLDAAVDLALLEGDAATEDGLAQVYLGTYYRTASGLWSMPIGDSVGGRVGFDDDGVLVPSVDAARTLMVGWSNDTDGWVEGQVFYSSTVLGNVQYGPPLPVPEPQSWAMLLAGAGVLAIRRKKTPRGRGVVPGSAGKDKALG